MNKIFVFVCFAVMALDASTGNRRKIIEQQLFKLLRLHKKWTKEQQKILNPKLRWSDAKPRFTTPCNNFFNEDEDPIEKR